MSETKTHKATVSVQVDDIEELEAWRELNRKKARAILRLLVEKALEIAIKGGEEK